MGDRTSQADEALDLHGIQEVFLPANGITYHTVQAGPEKGPPVVLLHGFPEFWYGWRKQIPALAEAGFRVIAPDLRGYHLSDKPRGIASYRLDILADDIIALIDGLEADSVFLAGHDWGGVIAWWVTQNYPERIAKLVILNAPHVSAYRRFLLRHPTQMLRSWYVVFFQLPLLPEALSALIGFPVSGRSIQSTSRPGTITAQDVARYDEALHLPRARTATINYYRAAGRLRARKRIDSPRITSPTLILWGRQDRFLELGLAYASLDLCDKGSLVILDEATHWVQHEEPERINALMIDFFQEKGVKTHEQQSPPIR